VWLMPQWDGRWPRRAEVGGEKLVHGGINGNRYLARSRRLGPVRLNGCYQSDAQGCRFQLAVDAQMVLQRAGPGNGNAQNGSLQFAVILAAHCLPAPGLRRPSGSAVELEQLIHVLLRAWRTEPLKPVEGAAGGAAYASRNGYKLEQIERDVFMRRAPRFIAGLSIHFKKSPKRCSRLRLAYLGFDALWSAAPVLEIMRTALHRNGREPGQLGGCSGGDSGGGGAAPRILGGWALSSLYSPRRGVCRAPRFVNAVVGWRRNWSRASCWRGSGHRAGIWRTVRRALPRAAHAGPGHFAFAV